MSIELPDPGQLVEVRRRQFVVTDVLRSSLPLDALHGGGVDGQVQHVVKLSSVEDDGIGDELDVVWEIEPGARIHEKSLLPRPDGFDEPRRLDAFLDAVRWGAIASADVRALQAPFRSGIVIEDFQLDPVVRALQMPRANLLIADDVGLGKTIEAGLVVQELLLRHRIRSVLVVCPSSLQIKWRDEMWDKFGLEFRIVDAESLKDLRRRRGIHVNPWTHFPRLITSIDFLKRDGRGRAPLQLFRECLPARGEPAYPRRFDLLIVDEAHNVAPSGIGRYATDSLRTLAIRTLAPHFEHKLFLTATPHNGYRESFSALLELLDDQRFARTVPPDPKQLEAVLVHRLKTEIENWDGTKRFPERRIEAIEVAYGDEEREAHHKLQQYGLLRQKVAEGANAGLATEFVLKLLKKRMFSSPAAFLATIEKHQKTLRGIEDADEKRKRPKPPPGILQRELERSEEEAADDVVAEEAQEEALAVAATEFEKLGDEERRLLRDLHDWARRASSRPDAKASELIAWLKKTVQARGHWNDERVILFTEYRATQKWLQEHLARAGLASEGRLMVLFGGMDTEERERIKAAFQANPKVSPVRILLATDAASEGIDLQNWCHRVVHYEIPWNPNRLEQRNGRVDRIGQKHQPLVYHFVGRGWDVSAAGSRDPGDLEGDLEFLAHAVRKVNAIREDLGKVGPVIARQVEEAMLGHRRKLDTSRAEADAKPVRQMLRFERDLRARIAALRERLTESVRELRVSPETVQAVVEMGLELAGQPKLIHAKLAVGDDSSTERKTISVFRLPKLRGAWARAAEGLAHPHSGELRPITFDHAVAAGRDDVVLVHIGHRLVQMCQRLLRAEVWAGDGRKLLNRVTARVVPDAALDTPAVVAHARLLVLGGTDQRLHEEIIVAGGTIREGRFARMNVGQTAAALAAATDRGASEEAKEGLQRVWPRIEESVRAALDARMNDRIAGLERSLREREAKEIADLSAIMWELDRAIRSELDGERPPQYEMFDRSEREQLERNEKALRERLSRIPDDIDREVAEIRRRYEAPAPRLFPVCLTFLVPERHDR